MSDQRTRPSDGANKASYCKQHAHLDSSAPEGEAGELMKRERGKVWKVGKGLALGERV